MTVSEYAQKHGLSEETVRRYIRDGKISAVKNGRSYDIIENTTTHDGNTTTTYNRNTTEIQQQALKEEVRGRGRPLQTDVQIETLQMHVDYLKQLLSEKDGLIGQLHSELEQIQMTLDEVLEESRESRERSDTIILQLTLKFSEQAKLLEDMRQKQTSPRVKRRDGKKSFWQRLFSKNLLTIEM